MQEDHKNIINDHLHELCDHYPHRSVGSKGNIHATAYFSDIARKSGYEVIEQEFACIDWIASDVLLNSPGQTFTALPSPWSLGYNGEAELTEIDSVDRLRTAEISGKIVLLHGNIAREQFSPKNFVFYNPKEHQEIIRLLEEKKPVALITATEKNPEIAGALYPFPLFEDGDFDIPSVYMTAEEGNRLLAQAGKIIRLKFGATRIPTRGCNIIARKGNPETKKIVITAHIDTKPDTPGALDNASGVIVMLRMLDIFRGYEPEDFSLEFLAMNGEDYYAASGEMKYLAENEDKLGNILFNINMDGIGFRGAKTGYTFLGEDESLKSRLLDSFRENDNFTEIEPWYQGDHMIFVMNGVPALTLTSDNLPYILTEIAHTERDTIDKIDPAMLEEIALTLSGIIQKVNFKQ